MFIEVHELELFKVDLFKSRVERRSRILNFNNIDSLVAADYCDVQGTLIVMGQNKFYVAETIEELKGLISYSAARRD